MINTIAKTGTAVPNGKKVSKGIEQMINQRAVATVIGCEVRDKRGMR